MDNQGNSEVVPHDVHYQPIVTNPQVWQQIRRLDFQVTSTDVIGGERGCFDRVAVIARDIQEKGTVLDIGCNIGFFSHVLRALGNTVTGIEDDSHVTIKEFTKKSSIDTASALNEQYDLDVEFIKRDFITFLADTDRTWDYTLFLSVFHHLFIGYGTSEKNRFAPVEAVKVLQSVARHTAKTMYFEIDERILEDFGWGTEDVSENVKMYTDFNRVEKLHESLDGWKKSRGLFKCWRAGARAPMGMVIPLSSSRRNNVGCVKGKSLFVTREANDWDASHFFGQAISRRQTVLDGQVLTKLRDNPHPHICRVVGFDERWVELEYVSGKILSNRTHTRWLPQTHVGQPDYLDGAISARECMTLIGQMQDAISALHDIGVCHTDLTAFNILVDEEGNAKIIDVIGCMPRSDELEELDWEVFTRFTVREVVERCRYSALRECIGANRIPGVRDFGDLLEKVEESKRLEQQLQVILNSRGWKLLEKLRWLRHLSSDLTRRMGGARPG